VLAATRKVCVCAGGDESPRPQGRAGQKKCSRPRGPRARMPRAASLTMRLRMSELAARRPPPRTEPSGCSPAVSCGRPRRPRGKSQRRRARGRESEPPAGGAKREKGMVGVWVCCVVWCGCVRRRGVSVRGLTTCRMVGGRLSIAGWGHCERAGMVGEGGLRCHRGNRGAGVGLVAVAL
jgi:hypothetical protein